MRLILPYIECLYCTKTNSRHSVYEHLGLINDEYNVEIDDQLGEIELGPLGPELLKRMYK